MLSEAQEMEEWSHFLSDLNTRVVELVISYVPKSVVQGYKQNHPRGNFYFQNEKITIC